MTPIFHRLFCRVAFCSILVVMGSLALAAESSDPHAAKRPAATYPAPINPEDVPLATSADIWVGVFTVPEGSPDGATQGAQPAPPLARGIFAYVANRSDHPIRLYTPGLVGPNFGAQKGSNLETLVNETRTGARFKSGDFVILRPGEMFARRSPQLNPNESGLEVGAYYLIYPPDKIGHWSEVAEVVYPGGQVHVSKR